MGPLSTEDRIFVPTEEMISEAINSMRHNSASGTDGIGIYHLQKIDPSVIYQTINEWA